jgi:hypothetical protein
MKELGRRLEGRLGGGWAEAEWLARFAIFIFRAYVYTCLTTHKFLPRFET